MHQRNGEEHRKTVSQTQNNTMSYSKERERRDEAMGSGSPGVRVSEWPTKGKSAFYGQRAGRVREAGSRFDGCYAIGPASADLLSPTDNRPRFNTRLEKIKESMHSRVPKSQWAFSHQLKQSLHTHTRAHTPGQQLFHCQFSIDVVLSRSKFFDVVSVSAFCNVSVKL